MNVLAGYTGAASRGRQSTPGGPEAWHAATGAPPSDLADATLLFASLQPLIEERRSAVIHLTGAGPRVGTTRVASALAAAAARHGWCRTLTVDAVAPPGRPGSLLAQHRAGGGLPLEPAADPNRRVFALAGPDAIPRPAELAALYEALRTRFALILVDCRPVAAVPDTAILSQAADLTLLVARAEHTRLASVTASRDLLTRAGAERIGLVLTGRRRIPAILDRFL